MKLLLIDGDIIRYRCGFAGQKTHYYMYAAGDVTYNEEEDSYEIKEGAIFSYFENAKDAKAWADNPENAETYVRVPEVKLEPVANTLHSVKRVMQALTERYPEYHPAVYVSCPTEDNWRYEFYPEYKANRKLQRKPYYAYDIDQYMRSKWDVIDDPHYEADDLIAQQAYQNRLAGDDYVVASIDKDLLQIPGSHWDWVKEEATTVEDMQAMRLLAAQRIAGDSTDNIKGIPGWGDKTAQAFLEQARSPDLEEIVANAFMQAKDRKGNVIFPNATEALYQARLTEALVTLPINDEHRDRLVERVNIARKTYEASQKAGEPAVHEDGGTG